MASQDHLTGAWRYRITWRGKLILQVQEKFLRMYDLGGSGHFDESDYYRWRDATIHDVQKIGLEFAGGNNGRA